MFACHRVYNAAVGMHRTLLGSQQRNALASSWLQIFTGQKVEISTLLYKRFVVLQK